MRAGALRHFVTIEMFSWAQNSLGEAIETWTTYAQLWANVEPLTGREIFSAGQIAAEIIAHAFCRFDIGITAKMRLVHEGKRYNIRSVINVGGRNQTLELLLEQGINDG